MLAKVEKFDSNLVKYKLFLVIKNALTILGSIAVLVWKRFLRDFSWSRFQTFPILITVDFLGMANF